MSTIDIHKTSDAKITEKKENAKEVDFDELLSAAGEFGRYQLLLFFSTFPFYMYGVFAYYSQLFMTEVSPNHWCWIPELANMTDLERRNLAIPEENNRYGYSRCEAYVANWTEVLAYGLRPNKSWTMTKCQNGWEFNKTEIPYPTISSELGWVCEKNSYQATAQSIFFIGSIVGGFVIGWIADRFGRLPAAVASNIFGCIGGLMSTFARDLVEFSVCRFIMGMSYDNCMMMVYLLVLEYVAPKYRSLISNMSFALFYGTTVTVLPWIALLCGNWKTISLLTSLPLALAVFAPLYMPESPRWLLSRGRINDAVQKILAIGRINRKEIPPKLIEEFKTASLNRKEEKKSSCIDLLRRPGLRKAFICICVVYTCCTTVFDALVRSVGQLDFDFFVSFSVTSFTEMPSMLLAAFILDWLGRRWLTAIVMTVSCIFSILTVLIGGGLVSVLCAMVARFTVNIAYSAAMQWAAEMLPISVRGSGLSVVHICGYIGTVISPYIVYLETYLYWLPLVLVACISGLAALLALVLPETAKKDMPQTFDEAEELVRRQKFWDFPCSKSKKETDVPAH